MDPRAWRRFRKNKGAIIGAFLVFAITSLAVFGPYLAPHDPNEQHESGLDPVDGIPVGPSRDFWLGADTVGRDQLSRLLTGAGVSLKVAFLATGIALALGVSIGLLSGFVGGLLDTMAMRVVDILLSLPFLLIAIAMRRVFESPELWVLYLLLGGLSWMTLARVTRAKTMQVRELEFVQAARALGASRSRILIRHVLPSVIGPAIVIGTTLVAQMIIAESAMSFLGLGVKPPDASWGSMLSDGQQLLSHAPRLVLQPGFFIMCAVFGFNLLGEGLRDALDPKD